MEKIQTNVIETKKFANLFQGHMDYHGETKPTGKRKANGKVECKSYTKDSIGLDRWELYSKHLTGKIGLGISPIDANNNCKFAAIDVDDYTGNARQLVELLSTLSTPFKPFFSKSKGLHLYVFFSEDVKASAVREELRKWLLVFGLPTNTELFPKQDKLFTDGKSNWINLPYFGDAGNGMITGKKGEILPLGVACDKCEESKVTYEGLREAYNSLPMNDAPICLQSLFLRARWLEDGDGRNEFLFNVAVYFKLKDSNTFEDKTILTNRLLGSPKEESEIEGQIFKSVREKDYSYRCTASPLCDNCNKDYCSERQFGKGGGEMSSLNFEELTQVMTDPPHYLWVVNGSKMIFYKERDLRDQNAFADQCMRYLHLVPMQVKKERWIKILKNAFSGVKVTQVETGSDLSSGSLLLTYFQEYLIEAPRAQARSQVRLGYVSWEEGKDEILFKKDRFLKFLNQDKNFNIFGPGEIQHRLKEFGVNTNKVVHTDRGNTRVWAIPMKLIENQLPTESAPDADFSDMVEINKELDV